MACNAKMSKSFWRRKSRTSFRKEEENVSSLDGAWNTDGKQEDNLLDIQYENKIRPYIDLIDSLRALGVEKDLALPAIAVIGDQSSGKSSVLEALSGVCLPRGSGIVTRCPLELKLKKNPRNTDWRATISYRNIKENIYSPSMVEQEVKKAQNIMAGTNNGISDELITLEIVSPNVPDLTLIDLPGITRIALPNQPKDIGQQIKQMIRKYITRQETINLAVVPCNVDVATTEALEMAREVDPSGNRTIGILTKPDLVDRGTEEQVLRTMQNKAYPLKKGYMIVKCRGQIDIQENMCLQDALDNEKAYFDKHPHYSALLRAGKATIPNLAERLTKELVTHIAKTLPDITYQIKIKLREAEDELHMIGGGLPDSEDDKIHFLIKIITDFTNAITYIVNGDLDSSEDLKLFKTLRLQFSSWDKLLIDSSIQFVDELSKDKDVENIYEDKYRGRELEGFINYNRFETILRTQILSFQEPAIKIIHDVSQFVQNCFTHEASKWFQTFKNLHVAALDKIHDISRKQEQQAENIIKLQLQMEGIVYCQDSIYREAMSKERAEGAYGRGVPLHEYIQLSVDDLCYHMKAYLSVSTTRLTNQIPLIIQHYILKEYAEKVRNNMILLIQNKQSTHLLEETSELAERRRALNSQIQRLRQAQNHLSNFSGQG